MFDRLNFQCVHRKQWRQNSHIIDSIGTMNIELNTNQNHTYSIESLFRHRQYKHKRVTEVLSPGNRGTSPNDFLYIRI